MKKELIYKIITHTAFVGLLLILITRFFWIDSLYDSKLILLSDLKPGQTAILIKTGCPDCIKNKNKINQLLIDKDTFIVDLRNQTNLELLKSNMIFEGVLEIPAKAYYDKLSNKYIVTSYENFKELKGNKK